MKTEEIPVIRRKIEKAGVLGFFGAGTLLSHCYPQLVFSLGRAPDFISDNAPEKWGETIEGLTCIPPEQIPAQGADVVVVITVRKYETIYCQLRKLGVDTILLADFDSGYYHINGLHVLDDSRVLETETKTPLPKLNGQWTLITGASRGVGRQIALAMARLGSHIIAHSRHSDHVASLMEECTDYDVQVVPIAADLGELTEVENMLRQLEEMVPRIDILFNNAAISPPNTAGVWKIPADIYQQCFAVNTLSPIRICQHLIPAMIQRGYGRVVNVNTHIEKRPNEVAYACSKAAIDKFVCDVCPTLKGTGVTMTLADPGWVQTDAGGPDALYPVQSVIPGILLGALLKGEINGCRFSAQDYSGMSLTSAMEKAKNHLSRCSSNHWI